MKKSSRIGLKVQQALVLFINKGGQLMKKVKKYNKKPHIAVFLHDLAFGGVERVAVNLIKGFVAQGLEVDVVLLWAEGIFLHQLPHEVQIVNLDAPRSLYPYNLSKLIDFLKDKQSSFLSLDCLLKINVVIWKLLHYLRKKSINRFFWLNHCALKLADYLRKRQPSAMLALSTEPNLIATRARHLICAPLRFRTCHFFALCCME